MLQPKSILGSSVGIVRLHETFSVARSGSDKSLFSDTGLDSQSAMLAQFLFYAYVSFSDIVLF